ncbi:MAG: nicotinate phosphoribosyltransferase [Chryseolinea sp.]
MIQFSTSGTYTDLYQISMAQVYFLSGRMNERAVFDYFFRKLPYSGGYAVFAGLQTVLEILQDFSFTSDDLEYLKSIGSNHEFVKSLKDFRFTGSVHAALEGEIVFPNEPILRVEGTILETQLVETILLNILNFQSLIATKAARMRYVAGTKSLSDFGLRRAQGFGGYHATRAAIVGGFNSTSNVKAARDFDITVVGTMAHAFVQSYESEITAFRDFALYRPEQCVLLVDTYDTLKSGVPNAITIAREMEQRSQKLAGIRLDSGDLAYLAKQSRKLLDDADLAYVKITASNQLDEYVIKSLVDQQAPIDVFGVGTSLVTGPPDAALDGVYKLASLGGTPRIKLSENLKKITLPGKKQVYRVFGEAGSFLGADAVVLDGEDHPSVMHHPYETEKSIDIAGLDQEPLLHEVMSSGKILHDAPSLKDISSYSQRRLRLVPEEYKRFYNPHIYKVGISDNLKAERNRLRHQYRR